MQMNWFKTIKKKCPKCDGSGIFPGNLPDDYRVECPTCEGKGVVFKTITAKRNIEQACDNPNCHNGKVKKIMPNTGLEKEVDCPVCSGLNRIVKEIYESWDETQACPTCEGIGIISVGDMRKNNLDSLCKHCHGTGYVFDAKKISLLTLAVVMVFLMPYVAFGVMLFSGLILSVRSTLSKKNKKEAK